MNTGRWAVCLLIAASLLVSLGIAVAIGSSARPGTSGYPITSESLPIDVVDNPADVFRIWSEKGYQDRIVVHVGRFLHFIEMDAMEVYDVKEKLPLQVPDVKAARERAVNDRNFLLATVTNNIAREVHTVLEKKRFRALWADVESGAGGARLVDEKILTHYFGSKRVIASVPPAMPEPVLLNIDASYFTEEEPGQLIRALEASGLKVEHLTLSMSANDEAVGEAERARLQRILEILGR